MTTQLNESNLSQLVDDVLNGNTNPVYALEMITDKFIETNELFQRYSDASEEVLKYIQATSELPVTQISAADVLKIHELLRRIVDSREATQKKYSNDSE